jgi:hypothetical protein
MAARVLKDSINLPSFKDGHQLPAVILLAMVALAPHFAVMGLGRLPGRKSLRTRPLMRQEST